MHVGADHPQPLSSDLLEGGKESFPNEGDLFSRPHGHPGDDGTQAGTPPCGHHHAVQSRPQTRAKNCAKVVLVLNLVGQGEERRLVSGHRLVDDLLDTLPRQGFRLRQDAVVHIAAGSAIQLLSRNTMNLDPLLPGQGQDPLELGVDARTAIEPDGPNRSPLTCQGLEHDVAPFQPIQGALLWRERAPPRSSIFLGAMTPLLSMMWLQACAGPGAGWLGSPDDSALDTAVSSDTVCENDEEICDGLDQDCDGEVDEGLSSRTWYLDADGDGYGDPEGGISGCETDAPSGHVTDGTDCDDQDPGVHPGAIEICNDGVWNSCEPDPSCQLGGVVDLQDADVILAGEASEDLAGRSASWTGDLNGDGFEDLFLDAQESDVQGIQSGSAYFLPGPLAAGEQSLADAPVRLRGASPYHWAARSLGGLGDTNGDGLDDVIVGVIRHDYAGFRAGAAHIFLGPLPDGEHALAEASSAFLYGEGEYEAAGSWTAAAGDLNGDGLADVLVAAMYSDRAGLNNGAVYVLHGPVTGGHNLADRADAIYDGEPRRDNEWAGRSTAGVGDIDGDGLDDFVVGADGNDRGGDGAGAAYLVLGPSPAATTWSRPTPSTPGSTGTTGSVAPWPAQETPTETAGRRFCWVPLDTARRPKKGVPSTWLTEPIAVSWT